MRARGGRAGFRPVWLVPVLGSCLLVLACGFGSQAAIDAAREKLARQPKSWQAWVELARALDGAGRAEDAMEAFETSFDHQCKDVTAYRRAAELAGSFGLFREARLFADLGLYEAPDDRECTLLAARALVSRGKHRKARDYLGKLGLESVQPFHVSPDRALLGKLRYKHSGAVFTVRTDVGRRAAEQFSVIAERVFRRYMQLFPGLKPPGFKIRIFLFNEKTDYKRMIQRYPHHIAESEGLTIKDASAIRVITCMESDPYWEGTMRGPEWVNRVLLHELNHVAMFLIGGGNIPLWLAEGYAEYTAGADPAGTNFPVGVVLRKRADVIKFMEAGVGGKKIMMPDLQRFVTGRTSGPGLYEHAWSLVHFLHHGAGGKYHARMRKMLDLISQGYGSSCFQRAFEGVDLERLEKEWHEYARSL